MLSTKRNKSPVIFDGYDPLSDGPVSPQVVKKQRKQRCEKNHSTSVKIDSSFRKRKNFFVECSCLNWDELFESFVEREWRCPVRIPVPIDSFDDEDITVKTDASLRSIRVALSWSPYDRFKHKAVSPEETVLGYYPGQKNVVRVDAGALYDLYPEELRAKAELIWKYKPYHTGEKPPRWEDRISKLEGATLLQAIDLKSRWRSVSITDAHGDFYKSLISAYMARRCIAIKSAVFSYVIREGDELRRKMDELRQELDEFNSNLVEYERMCMIPFACGLELGDEEEQETPVRAFRQSPVFDANVIGIISGFVGRSKQELCVCNLSEFNWFGRLFTVGSSRVDPDLVQPSTNDVRSFCMASSSFY